MNWFHFTAVKHCIPKVFTFAGIKANLIKAIQSVFGLHLTNFDDSKVIVDLKRFESICVSFNILPNGFDQDQSITPSKWTKTKSIIYSSLMTVNIVHLLFLSVFDSSQNLSIILGDFFYGHPSRRYIWIYWTILFIFGEVLRHYWIHLHKTGKSFSYRVHKGYKPEALFMSQFYCHKYSFVASTLANLWIRTVLLFGIALGPVLIIIVQLVSQLPKTPQQFIFTYSWLLIGYFGIFCTLANLILTGAIITIDLSYFFLRGAHVTQALQNFVDKMCFQRSNFLPCYEKIIEDIVVFLNQTQSRNHKVRNWLIFLYLGISFSADFGFYTAAIVHIDHGSLDFVTIAFSALSIFSIGTCSYINGIMLAMMQSCYKNNMKVAKYLPSNVNSFIKFADLQSRLSRTDIAFTIGSILDMTKWLFVIYLIENAVLVMMFIINVK